MSELGATSDPAVLIPGSPEAIEENVIAIRERGESMIDVGEGLQRIDTGAWVVGLLTHSGTSSATNPRSG